MLCCGRCQTRSLCVKTSSNILCTGNSLPENAPLAPQLHNNENVHVTTRVIIRIGLLTFGSQGIFLTPNQQCQSTVACTHTHTHTFNGPFSKTTQVSWYQKGKPIWILLKRETVVAVASAGPYASLHLAPDGQPCQHHTTQFLQAGCPSCCPTNSVKALKACYS